MTGPGNKNPVMLPLIAAIVALIFWGGTAIANRYAVGFVDPISIASLRSMLAGVFALVLCLLLRLPFPATRRDFILLLISGLFSFAVWPLAISLGVARTTAGHAALIMAMLPVFTVLIASVVHRTLPQLAWWIGGTLALIATAILISFRGGSVDVEQRAMTMTGDLIILVGSVLCSAGYVAGAKLTPKIGSFATTFWGLSIALIVTAPVFAFSQSQTDWSVVPVTAWWAIAWLTFCSSLLGYVLWFYALGHGGIEKIGSLQLLMPVVTLAGAAWLLGEVLTMQLIVLSVVVLLGTFISHRYSTRHH